MKIITSLRNTVLCMSLLLISGAYFYYNDFVSSKHSEFIKGVNQVNHDFESAIKTLDLIDKIWSEVIFFDKHNDTESKAMIKLYDMFNYSDNFDKIYIYSKYKNLIYHVEKGEIKVDERVIVDLDFCGNKKIVQHSKVRKSELSNLLSIDICKTSKNLDFIFIYSLHLKDEVIFNSGFDYFNKYSQITDKNFESPIDNSLEYIEINRDLLMLLPSYTNIVFFQKLHFDYFLIERWSIIHPLETNFYLIIFCFFIIFAINFYIVSINEKNRLISINQKKSITDTLTGVYNIEYLKNYIQADLSFSQGAFIYIDGNNIKDINDRLGHSYGDKAIQCICEAISNSCDSKDRVIRLGGDEFLLITHKDYKYAEEISDKINEDLLVLSSSEFPFLEESLSISSGVSSFEGFENLNSKIKKADLEMLKNKCTRKL